MTQATFFETAAAFRRWLARHGSTHAELIVGFHKVGSGRPSMGWSESVDEALCFGWIDGVRKRIDASAYQIRFTPRKPSSIWSAVNIAKYRRLEACGRMKPAGVEAFARRTDKRSAVYAYEQEEMPRLSAAEVRAFQDSESAWRYLEATPPGYRRVVLHWIVRAKKPETRAARLAKLVEACAAGTRLR